MCSMLCATEQKPTPELLTLLNSPYVHKCVLSEEYQPFPKSLEIFFTS